MSAVNTETMQAWGKDRGAWWAKAHAKPAQLERLTAAVAAGDGRNCGTGDAEDLAGGMNNGMSKGTAVGLYLILSGAESGRESRAEAREFWDTMLLEDAEKINDTDFAAGFIEGVLGN